VLLKPWEELPDSLRMAEVRRYYDILQKKRASLIAKRLFDVIVSAIMMVVLSPIFALLAIAIKLDSEGPVFYRQVRVTQYGKPFRIHKFRSMVNHADKRGTLVTVNGDSRITRIGRLIREKRLDEIAQLIDVFLGTMTFVGTRPEVPKYVAHYTPEMMATLLLPAGVTSLTSIFYSGESALLDAAKDPDKVYVEDVLPGKMKWNLKGIEQFSFWRDIRIMVMTVLAVCGKKYKGDYEEAIRK